MYKFDAPTLYLTIPDIEKIYAINDGQCDQLDADVETLNGNIFLDSMDSYTCGRWESMLGITALDDDKISDRRFRIKSKVMERLPYTYKVILNKLDTLCPYGYIFLMSNDKLSAEIKISLKSKKMMEDVKQMLEDMLPLNINFVVKLIYNSHNVLKDYKYSYLGTKTHRELREEVLE